VNARTAWASGTCLVVRGPREIWFATGAARVFRSTDGGLSWTVTPTPLRQPESSAGIFSLALGPGPTAVAVGGDYRQPQQTRQTAAFTTNHGATWTPAPGLSGYRSAAAFFTRTTVIAVGTNGADLSTDGGKTWQPLAAAGYHAVQSGWAVGPQGRIARVTLK
ncbi:MAG: WD40/YVTN/BNR-like repeat-containing protein, partial [Acidobacteriota bacterium]